MARRENMVAIAAVMMVLLTALAPIVVALPSIQKQDDKIVWQQGSDSEPSFQSGSGTYQDIYLYFHRATQTQQTYVMNTMAPSAGVDVMPSAGSVTYRLQEPLTKNLKVQGHEITASTKGFWLDLSVSAFPSATVTITVLDGETPIANHTQSVSGTFSRWTVPFIGGTDSYTFVKGSTIAVRISTTGTTTVNLANGDKLWVLCDPVSLTGDTYNSNGAKTKTFYPNDIQENRDVVIKGRIDDAFGATDISSVTITIKNGAGTTMVDATASRNGLNYTYNWNYSGGLTSGSYTALIEMDDQQGNAFNISVDFTMATYGVKLDSPQARDSGAVQGAAEKGGCVDYTVSVMNIGSVDTSYALSQTSSDVSGWSLTITPSQTGSVSAGESKLVTVKVCADDSVQEGTQSTFYVQAQATTDPSAKDTILIITTASPKVNLTLKWTTTSGTCQNLVNTGGSVACGFELQNSGLQSLNVTLKMSIEKGSPDWTARVVPSTIMQGVLLLHPQQIIAGTLNITAPKDPSKQNKSIINIQAEVDDPPLIKSITATTVMSTGISLEVVGDEKVKIDSDKTAEFFILVSNSDPNNAHTITISTVQPAGWSVDFVASSKSFSLNAQDSETVRIKVTPSGTAAAGTYNIEVTGKYADNPSTWDKATMQVEINEKHSLSMTVTPASREVGAEEGASFTVTVTNNGNVDEKSATLIVQQTSGDLKATVDIDGNRTLVKGIKVPRGQSSSFVVKITPKAEAKHKDSGTFSIKAQSVVTTVSTTKNVEVKLMKDKNQLFQETIRDWQMWILIILFIVVLAFYGMVIRR